MHWNKKSLPNKMTVAFCSKNVKMEHHNILKLPVFPCFLINIEMIGSHNRRQKTSSGLAEEGKC